MKTIINTAKDIEALKIENEYTVKRFMSALEVKTNIEKYLACDMEVDTENDDQVTLWIDRKAGVEITKMWKDEYSVFARNASIAWSQLEEIKKELKEPNNFKVLSLKNLQNWIAYTIALKAACQKKAEDNNRKITEFLAKVDTMQKAGCKLVMSESGLHGWLENDNFTLSFTCDQQSGYTSQNLRINDGQTIETMAKLSNITL